VNRTGLAFAALVLLICAAILWRLLGAPGKDAETSAGVPVPTDAAAPGGEGATGPREEPPVRETAAEPPASPESRPAASAPIDRNTSALLTVRVLAENGAPVPGARVGTAIAPFYQGEDRFVGRGHFNRLWGNTTVIRNAADLSSTSAVADAQGKAVFKVTGFHDLEIRQSAILLSVEAEGFVPGWDTAYVLKAMSVLSKPEVVFRLTKPVIVRGSVSGFRDEDHSKIILSFSAHVQGRDRPWNCFPKIDKAGSFEAEVVPDHDLQVYASGGTLVFELQDRHPGRLGVPSTPYPIGTNPRD